MTSQVCSSPPVCANYAPSNFTVQEIESRITDHFGISRDMLYRQYRGLQCEKAFPRHVFVYCLRMFANMTFVQIAGVIGFHHTCAINSIKAVKNICCVDKDVRKQVVEVESLFEN